MKFREWRRTLACLAASMLPAGASANGVVYNEPHRGGADVWLASPRLALVSERLSLAMHAKHYTARVMYTVEDRGGSGRTTMYFPIVCTTDVNGGKTPPCIREFEATLNGQPLPSRVLQARQVQGAGPLKQLLRRLDTRLPKPKRDEADIGEERTWFVYRIDIPAGTQARELAVSYRADYAQASGGTSKSAVSHYGTARLVYDFLPAALWAGAGTTQLQIDVDTRGLKSPLMWSHKDWPFTQIDKDTLRAVVPRPAFATLPPLHLATENRGYRLFTDHMDLLRRGQVRYTVSPVGKATPASTRHGDLNALIDRDPATFWYWRGAKARIALQFNAVALVSYVPGQMTTASFEGLALLNGANANMSTASGHGGARLLTVSAGAEHDQEPFTLGTMKTDQDRFHSWASMRAGRGPGPEFHQEVADHQYTEAHRKQIRRARLVVHITGTRTGENDENCISELYPLYNPG